MKGPAWHSKDKLNLKQQQQQQGSNNMKAAFYK